MKKTITLEEASKRLRGLSVEDAARLDANAPPFEPETNPRRRTLRMKIPPSPAEKSNKDRAD